MTTKHFNTWADFEKFGSTQPYGTQYFIRKVSPQGLDVLVTEPKETMPSVEQAESFAAACLGDPSMECKVTGVTEFGFTGTCVPRVSHAPEHICWWCNKPGATKNIVDPIGPGKDWMHDACYWEVNKIMMD